MRLGDGSTALSEPINGIVTRLGGVGEALVTLYADSAPLAVKQESIIRLAAYLYDSPDVRSGDRYAAAWRNSGAASLVSPWVERRVATDDGSPSTSTPSNFGGNGVSEAQALELIAEWARNGNTDQIPADKLANAGGAAHDQVARDAAAAAQSDADAAGSAAMSAAGAAAVAQGTADARTTVSEARDAAREVASDWAEDGNTDPIPADKLTAFDSTALNIENWAFRDQNVRVQPRKLGEFPSHDIDQIPWAGEQYFRLKARVHKNVNGAIVAYDLGEWEPVAADGEGGGPRISRYSLTFDADTYVYTSTTSQLSIAYPEGTDRAYFEARMKTGWLFHDPDQTFATGPMTERSSSVLQGHTAIVGGETRVSTVRFRDDIIRLDIVGVELAADERNTWILSITAIT